MGQTVSNEAFSELCKHFEGLVRERCNLDEHANPYFKAARLPGLREYSDELDVIRSLRNLYAHTESHIDGQDAYYVSEVTYNTLAKIVSKLENPATVDMYYVKPAVTARRSDHVRYVIHLMQKHGISHVPILNGHDAVEGCFSENSVFSHIGRHDANRTFDPDVTIGDVMDDLYLNAHDGEYFAFIAVNGSIDRAKEMFGEKQGRKRLKMMFVTQHGKEEEKLLGVLTPWDILD